MNGTGNMEDISAETVPPKIEDARRRLILLRNKHGATSAIGSRCSNIVELIQVPEVPKFQLERQMADLQRLLQAVQ